MQGVQAAVYAGRCKVCTSVKDLGGREEAETFITRFLQLSRACDYQRGCRGVQIAVYAGWRKVCTSVTTDGGTGGEAVETTLRLSLP